MKQTVVLQLDFRQGPLWISDFSTGTPQTGISVIDTDEQVRKLNYEIQDLYDSYYEFDSHGQAVWFNEEQEKRDKSKMLDLFARLNARLDQINDGTFTVDDRETERIRNL